jgi:hypothetical protein
MAARRRLVLSIVVFVCGLTFAAVPAHAAAILLVDSNGLLTGATGVNVGGKLYDVEFVEGTCSAVFDGCDANTDFTFVTLSDATAASQALLDQVFLDVPGLGTFGTTPSLTFGCQGATPLDGCFVQTPMALVLNSDGSLFGISYRVALNVGDVSPGDGVISNFSFFSADTAADNSRVNARWTPTPDVTVPEPATMSLLGLGLAGIGARRWRQRKTT